MKSINEKELENVCGGGKIAKVVEKVSLACIIGGMIVTSALVLYDSAKTEELKRRKRQAKPKIRIQKVETCCTVKTTYVCDPQEI